MINLIPPSAKEAVTKEYWVRVISVYLFILSAVCLIVILFTLRLYILVSLQVDNHADSATKAINQVAEYDLSAGALVRANVMAQKIIELRGVDYFSEVILLLESLQGTEISISGYEFSRDKTGNLAPMQIRGTANTRQALANFRDAILSHKSVAEAVLPISNLTKDRDIQFSITVTFKEKI
jgi:hypothetical protein